MYGVRTYVLMCVHMCVCLCGMYHMCGVSVYLVCVWYMCVLSECVCMVYVWYMCCTWYVVYVVYMVCGMSACETEGE